MYISSSAYLTPLTDNEQRVIANSLGDDYNIEEATQCIIEIAAVLCGNKLAAMIHPSSQDEMHIFNDAIKLYNIPFKHIRVLGSNTQIIVGSMKSADIIQQEYDRVSDLIKKGILEKPDDRFHRLIGMALGYPIDKIEAFISTIHIKNNIGQYLSDSEKKLIDNMKVRCKTNVCRKKLYEENLKLTDNCLSFTSGEITSHEWDHIKKDIIANIYNILDDDNSESLDIFARQETLMKMIKNAKIKTDGKKKGAGILYVCPENNSIFLILRSDKVSHPNMWSVPGGMIERDEDSFYAAKRECVEEIGMFMNGEIIDSITYKSKDFQYETFIVELSGLQADKLSESISLNWESLDAKWFDVNQLPSNLHFGVKHIKNYLSM